MLCWDLMKGFGGRKGFGKKGVREFFFFFFLINCNFKQKKKQTHDLSSLFLDEPTCIHDMA